MMATSQGISLMPEARSKKPFASAACSIRSWRNRCPPHLIFAVRPGTWDAWASSRRLWSRWVDRFPHIVTWRRGPSVGCYCEISRARRGARPSSKRIAEQAVHVNLPEEPLTIWLTTIALFAQDLRESG
jgi:hypothetical protein